MEASENMFLPFPLLEVQLLSGSANNERCFLSVISRAVITQIHSR